MWPSLNIFHPSLAKAAMQYRFDRMTEAAANALAYIGVGGLKYP